MSDDITADFIHGGTTPKGNEILTNWVRDGITMTMTSRSTERGSGSKVHKMRY